MVQNQYSLWIGGRWRETQERLVVHSPFTGKAVAEQGLATKTDLDEAALAARDAFASFRFSSRYLRSRLLSAISRGIEAHRAELVERIIGEAGKPRQLAEGEVTRCVGTFQYAAEAAKSFAGGLVPIDADPQGRAFGPAIWEWVPRGPVLGIAPFNFPLNLVAHKVAPALAVGAPIVIKPPPQAPGATNLLARIFEQAAREVSDSRETVPMAALQIFHAKNEIAETAVADPRYAVFTFTGSDVAGWKLREKAGHKKVVLELGGNAAVIVHRDADLKRAAERCAYGGFAYAGQVCISVQRIFVDQEIEKQFSALLRESVQRLKSGDPSHAETLVGPVIDSRSADRIEGWIADAKRTGAKTLLEGPRQKNLLAPSILSEVAPDQKLASEEVFGPVVTLDRYAKLEEAIATANRSRFGLQAGVFASNEAVIRQAARELEVGGVIVNEVPTFRADHMPYGGVKESGIGREGVLYAMEEFCDRKTIVNWRG